MNAVLLQKNRKKIKIRNSESIFKSHKVTKLLHILAVLKLLKFNHTLFFAFQIFNKLSNYDLLLLQTKIMVSIHSYNHRIYSILAQNYY